MVCNEVGSSRRALQDHANSEEQVTFLQSLGHDSRFKQLHGFVGDIFGALLPFESAPNIVVRPEFAARCQLAMHLTLTALRGCCDDDDLHSQVPRASAAAPHGRRCLGRERRWQPQLRQRPRQPGCLQPPAPSLL